MELKEGMFFYSNNEQMHDFDFNRDGKVDAEDYKLALKYMNENSTDNAFGFSKEKINKIFAQFVEQEGTLNKQMTLQKGQRTVMTSQEADNYDRKYFNYEKLQQMLFTDAQTSIKEANRDILDGLTSLSSNDTSDYVIDSKMLDGSMLAAVQNDTILKNIEEYSSVLGSKITDYEPKTSENSYMEEYLRKIDTGIPIEE